MSNLSFGDKSRLVIKNIPNSLDNKSLDKLITKKCRDIGLNKCDVRLLTKEKNVNGSIERISRGICYVGFISELDATKFLSHYNNSYFNSCKVTIDYSKSPSYSEKRPINRAIPSKNSETPTQDGTVVTEVVPRKAGVSSKRIHVVFDSDSEDQNTEDSSKSTNGIQREDDGITENNGSNDPQALDMNRVVIFNLPYSFTEEMIRKFVKPFGKVEKVNIPLNNHNFSDPLAVEMHTTKGMCFVTFSFESDAVKFVEQKNNTIFLGRIITIALANARSTGDGHIPSMTRKYHNKRRNEVSFEKFKMKKRMQEITNTDIWNILHIDISSAVNAIASELELEQDEILKSEEAGVNVALSESYILNQIKEWMTRQGINYEVKEYREEDTHEDLLLIKNLPYNADDKELIRIFSECGQIVRFATSPFKLLGLVQFSNKFECDKALRSLSYRMYRSLPIYLQRVSKQLLPTADSVSPVGESLEGSTNDRQTGHKGFEAEGNEKDCTNQIGDEESEEDTKESEDRVGHVSVYVTNLAPGVEESELDKHFAELDGFVISKVIKPASEVERASGDERFGRLRYGFVEFNSMAHAREAIKRRCGTVIAGRVINLELAKSTRTISKHRRNEGDENEENDVIIVKNLPFQANKREVMELFRYYGNVKTVRIPKSAGNTHRGFAFVHFVSKADARAAMENLGNVHLYGRRLVLQYAESAN